MIKAGLLGLGTIGKIHLEQGYRNNPVVRLEACFDINPTNLELANGLRCYTDLDEFFQNEQGKLDYLDICLPTFMHKEIVTQAMRQGFHVLSEKPMALNPEDADQMITVAKETGKTLMIAHCLRFHPYYMTIRDHIHSNILGKLQDIKYTVYRAGLPVGQNGWFRNFALSGGPILDVHVHDMDLLLWLLGTPQKLCTVGKAGDLGYDRFSTHMVYPDYFVNFQCNLSLPVCNHQRSRSLRLNFENGYIILDKDRFLVVDANGNETDLTTKGQTIYRDEINYFAESIQKNAPTDRCPPEQSAKALRLIFAEIESAQKGGEWITLS